MFEVSFELEGKTFIARVEAHAECDELKVYEAILDSDGMYDHLRDINPRGISLWSSRLPDSVRPGDKALRCQRDRRGRTYHVTTIARVTARTVDDVEGNKYALSSGDEWGTGGITWKSNYKSIHAYDLDFLADEEGSRLYAEYRKQQKLERNGLIELIMEESKNASVEQLQAVLDILQKEDK